jgi:endoglucanase
MTKNKLFHTFIGTIFIFLFAVGCSKPTPTPVTPSATRTQKPPTFTPTYTHTPTNTPTVGPGGFPLRFHVEGNAFVDQYGQKMVFRGMASPDIIQMALRENPNLSAWNEQYFQAMASWGSNIIRVPITPYGLRKDKIDKILEILDQTVAWAGANKMYVMIDFHSCGWLPENWFFPDSGNETTVEEWTYFWKTMSSHYADNDVVAFYELFNEPALNSHWPYTKADWLAWKDLVEPLINDTIRPNDPDKIIVVGGLQAGYDLSYVLGAPINDISNNVAYGTQPYPGQYNPTADHATKSGWDIAFGNLSKKYPVFATEFGYAKDFSVGDPMVGGIPYHQAIIDYLEAHNISWTVWCFDAYWQIQLLKDNTTFEPTESGEYFRSRLLELNPQL